MQTNRQFFQTDIVPDIEGHGVRFGSTGFDKQGS